MADAQDPNRSPSMVDSYLVENPRFPFCKGCGHTMVLRRLNEALVALQVSPQKICLVTDIGCIGLADGLFREIHTVHTTHGRSTAFATGIALADSILADSGLKTIVLIGDGGAMIGLQHLVHAAMLNVNLTVLIGNNFVYGMTGGQGSSLTPECFVTATTPGGNIVPPLDMCEVLKHSNAPFVARTFATDAKLPELLREAISFNGFCAIEILELCTEFAVPSNELTGKKLEEIAERNRWRLGSFQNKTSRSTYAERHKDSFEQEESARPVAPVRRIKIPRVTPLREPVSILVAGSAGERVQSSASLLCQAAATSGLTVTQKNDNPVTQGSGFSLSELWLSPGEIGFTGIEHPDFVIITSEDGYKEVRGRGWFDNLGQGSTVVLDDSIGADEMDRRIKRLPLRKTFGAKQAALGALTLLATAKRLVDEENLVAQVNDRYGDESSRLMQKVDELQRQFDVKGF